MRALLLPGWMRPLAAKFCTGPLGEPRWQTCTSRNWPASALKPAKLLDEPWQSRCRALGRRAISYQRPANIDVGTCAAGRGVAVTAKGRKAEQAAAAMARMCRLIGCRTSA